MMTFAFFRCAECYAMYVPVIDAVTASPRWNPPRVVRGGCRHESGIEAWDPEQNRWDVRERAS